MFQRTKAPAAISQELIDELTDRGRRDLSRLRMDDLETEVYELVDAITRRVVCREESSLEIRPLVQVE